MHIKCSFWTTRKVSVVVCIPRHADVKLIDYKIIDLYGIYIGSVICGDNWYQANERYRIEMNSCKIRRHRLSYIENRLTIK